MISYLDGLERLGAVKRLPIVDMASCAYRPSEFKVVKRPPAEDLAERLVARLRSVPPDSSKNGAGGA
jgi:hypothetical protein